MKFKKKNMFRRMKIDLNCGVLKKVESFSYLGKTFAAKLKRK